VSEETLDLDQAVSILAAKSANAPGKAAKKPARKPTAAKTKAAKTKAKG
jgi:topoisomerase IA-like protein